jgi:hypothetical protein
MPPDLATFIDEISEHAGAAVSAVRRREGGADMGKIEYVLLLAATGRTLLLGEEAALADFKDATHPADREPGLLLFNEAERQRSLYREEGGSFFSDVALLLQDRILTPQPLQLGVQSARCLTRLISITLLTQPERQRRQPDALIIALSLRVLPPVSASRTASHRNPGIGLFPFP